MKFQYFSSAEGPQQFFQEHKLMHSAQELYDQMCLGQEEAKCVEVSKGRGKRSKAEGRRGEGRKNGHWDTEENKRYHWFLQIHSNHFINKQMRRMDKIFKSMARFVGSREAEQCRSHHQKMEKKFHSFSMIIRHLRTSHYDSFDEALVHRDILTNGVTCNTIILSYDELRGLEVQQVTCKEFISPVTTVTLEENEEKSSFFGDPIQQLLAEEEHDSFLCNVFR